MLARRQARAILFYLANTYAPVSRAELLYLFWSDEPEAKARRNLTRLVSYLRKELPHPEILLNSRESLRVNPENVRVDVERFTRYCADETTYERAIPLYRGTFLMGFSLAGSPEFDFWLTEAQGRYETLYLKTISDLVHAKMEQRDSGAAIQYAQQYLVVDELAEEIHRDLITLYAAEGNRAAALKQYETCVEVLERELGVSPLPETRAAYEAALDESHEPTSPPLLEPAWMVLPSLHLPLVSREDAWETLESAYQRLHSGGVILITGEAGVGKSRLMQEFAMHGNRIVLTGNNHPSTQSLPYHPLVQALQQALPLSQLWTDIPPIWLGELKPLLPELHDHFPGLPRPITIEPSQAQTRLFEALTWVFLGLAAQAGSMLLCLDDLHWVDETTLAWLRAASQRLANSQVCILGTYRQEERDSVVELQHAFRRAGLLVEVPLAGLFVQGIGEVLQRVSGDGSLRPRLASRLHQITGGNTFFVLEMVRKLLESEQLDAPPETLPLPKTVRETIQARLARLNPLARQILDAASVLSPTLEPALISQTAGRTELETAGGLDELVLRQILQEGPDGLAFRHELLRTTVYQALTPWRQRVLHRRAAEGLERRYRAQFDSSYNTLSDQIAAHFERGGFPGKAIPHYQQAAATAQRVYALAEAYNYTVKGLALLEKVVDKSEYASQELDLQLLLGAILLDTERLFDPQTETAFGRAVELSKQLQEPLKQAIALEGLVYFNVNRTSLDQGYSQAKQLLALAQELKNSEFLVQAHWDLGAISLFRGQFTKARNHLERAKAHYQREGSTPTMVFGQPADMACYAYLAQVFQYLGYSDQALEHIHTAINLAQRAEHLVYLVPALMIATQLHQQRGDGAAALAAARELLALSGQYQVPFFRLIGNLYTGWALFNQGQREKGLDHAGQALFMLRQIPPIPATPLYLSILAEVYTQAGQLEKAGTLLDQAWAVMEETGVSIMESDLCRLRGELFWRQGKPATFTEPNFLRAVQVAREQGAKSLELRAVMSLARWWQNQDRHEEARQKLAEVYHWFTEGFDTVYLKAARTLLEELP